MRIAVAAPNRQLLGGAEQYLRGLLPALRESGHEVLLVVEEDSPKGEGRVDASLPDDAVHVVGRNVPSNAVRRIAAWHADVVYSQGLTSPALESLLLASLPCVLYVHSYYGTCGTGEKRYRRPKLTMCERRFGPGCLALNYALGCGTRRPRTLLAFYRRQTQRLEHLAHYRTVLVGSQHMHAVYRQHSVGDDRLQLLVLPRTGTAPVEGRVDPRALSGRVLFAGRLTPLKGCAYLVDALPVAAAALQRPLTLVVAGNGPEEKSLRECAMQKGVAAEFHGWVGAPRLQALYADADLLAVPSLWPEPFGLVGIEAAGAGLPAVGFAVGGIPDWLVPGVTGELARGDPPTPAGLAAAIVRALADPAHYAALRAGATAKATAYTMAAHVAQLTQVLTAAAFGEAPGDRTRTPSREPR